MANKLPDKHQPNEAMRKIIQYGGTHELDIDRGEYFDEWLIFLANPINLQPGLPALTLSCSSVMDDSSIWISFDQQRASIRSMKFELMGWSEGNAGLFLRGDSERKFLRIDGKPRNPSHIKKWVFNLFLHSGLEELKIPSIKEVRELLSKLPNTKITWTPFTPNTNGY